MGGGWDDGRSQLHDARIKEDATSLSKLVEDMIEKEAG
jgi:hypothetical protein